MSDTITAAQSIQAVMGEVGWVKKGDRNEFQNFNFRGIDAVMNAVGPALRKVGGFILPEVVAKKYVPGISSQGKPQMDVRLDVRFSWYGTDGGDPISTVIPAEASDTADKGTAKAMSVAYRTYLLQVLCLPTGEPDPDEAYPERGDANTVPSTPSGKPPRRTSTRATAAANAAAQAGAIPARTVASRNWIEEAERLHSVDELRELWGTIGKMGELNLPVTPSGPTVKEYMLARKKELLAAETPADDSQPTTGEWPVAQIPTKG